MIGKGSRLPHTAFNRGWTWFWLASVLVWASACSSAATAPEQRAQTERVSCVDRDGDGFGEHCANGSDCNDHDRSVHDGCLRCAVPNQGCACDPGSEPLACYLDKTKAEDGTVMCHEGTRYCREDKWSDCESIQSYPLPAASTTALVDTSVHPAQCNDCNVLCYRIIDQLDPEPGGLTDENSNNVEWVPGGGLTLGLVPGTEPPDPADPPPPLPCTLGVAPDNDCDGIPNEYDADPDDPPFATANPSIFLDIAPGETGTGAIDLAFNVNSADVYFLVDQTGSMDSERDKLKADLTTGDFINDASYQCADYDFDHVPNNELKDEGIVGAIRCMIRDANFGTGFFREIPFPGYAASDYLAFANYHDISGDHDSVRTAIGQLTTIGNYDWPEASMVGLYSVLTGNGMYFGTTKQGIPPRQDCPALTWGYPCFRQNAIPIVVMFTDAQFHNGPSNNSFAYSSSLPITSGTAATYYPLAATNETFATAADLSDLTSSYKTFTGDTSAMSEDPTLAGLFGSCLSSYQGTDALFRFELTQQKSVIIESTGSQFDTVLGLFTGIPGTPTTLPASANTNEIGSTALALGEAHGSYLTIAGNTTAMAGDYQWSDVGCGAATAAPDAMFKFDVSSTTQIAIDTSGSGFDTVVGLYAAAPALPPTYTAVAGNDAYDTAHSVGNVAMQWMGFSGNTSSLVSDYSAAQVGCGAENNAKDATFAFTLLAPRRIRISSEGSAFDTVLGLYDGASNPVGSAAVGTANENYSTAYDSGTLDGRIFQLSGSTAAMTADYFGTQICNSNSSAKDAVFKFHLDAPKDVQIDTIGGSWNSVLSLFNQAPDSTTSVATSNGNEAFASAQNLGTLNDQDLRVTGGTTTGMASDYWWSSDQCVSFSYPWTFAPDAAYKFHLNTATNVKIDLAGSSFDTTVALHSLQPTEASTPVPDSSNETLGTALSVGSVNGTSFLRTGTTTGMAHNYNIGCSASNSGRDAVFQFTVTGGSSKSVQIDTTGNAFDTVLGLYPSTIVQAASAATTTVTGITSNYLQAAPYDIGTLDNNWSVLSGSTSSAGAEWTDNHCSSASSSNDAYYKFTLASTRNVNISIANVSWSAKIMLYGSPLVAGEYEACGTSSSSISRSLTAGTYYIVVKGNGSSSKGSYDLTVKDTTTSNQIDCDNDGGSGNASQIVATLSPGTYNVVLSGTSSGASGTYSVRFRDKTWWDSLGYMSCDDNGGGGTSSQLTANLAAGDYGILVKGRIAADKGAYNLRVTDLDHPPIGVAALACDNDSGGSNQAMITQTALPAGDYWVVLKGYGAADAGNYLLNLKDTAATASGAIIQCDDNSGESPSSLIERDLVAGSYQVVVKGKAAADAGAYKLSFRDTASYPISQIACDDDSGSANGSYLESSLNAGSYYIAVKGKTASSKGALALSLRDVTNRPITTTACDDNGSSDNTSKITRTLNAGTYYVALKGKTASESGPYQLSIGAGSTSSSNYVPPTWAQTLAAIQSTKARVIPILSCHDDPQYGDAAGDCVETRTQATALANASQALGSNLAPLVFDIDRDGTGLSTSVVDAVSELAKYLEMNVSVRIVWEPDANPGFIPTVVAVDQAGDGCTGLIDVEHQHCTPGATPRFLLHFENPASAPVPLNPDDPQGGYNFKAELIGDSQFIVDSIPIYVIPEALAPMEPPAPEYYSSGEYHQDLVADTCNLTQAPDWNDLSWSAEVYGNTSVSFSVCAAATALELEDCTPLLLATVTGAGACIADGDCPLGYCHTSIDVCQVATAGACITDSECAANAFCNLATSLCTYDSQPVHIGAVLGSDNLKPYLRMSVGLTATEPFDGPPLVHSWEVNYECRGVL